MQEESEKLKKKYSEELVLPTSLERSSSELIDMDRVSLDPAFSLRIPASLALKKKVIPIAVKNQKVYVACEEEDPQTLRLIQRYYGMMIEAKLAEPESLQRAIHQMYGTLSKKNNLSQKLQAIHSNQVSVEDTETATELGEEILYSALLKKASDIHIEPYENSVRIRFRVDGILEEYRQFPKNMQAALTSRFKVLSGLDIAEKRAPQDGGFRHMSGEKKYDIRVATIPSKHGERISIRILSLQTEHLSLTRLGMNEQHFTQFQHSIRKPHGLILLTGPTGSGKTTTLYAAIREILQEKTLNIITIEDPVEYEIYGITQVEVDSGDKVSFHKALRSALRHDPDVILIGEIRDRETVDVAIKSALTGHLVFSTLHTNSAVGAITRLIDMGVPRYLIGATLRATLAQKLVRKLCIYCRKKTRITLAQSEILRMSWDSDQFIYEKQGCLYCQEVGYAGRIALFELLILEETWSKMIVQGAEENDLFEQMRQEKIPTLLQDGLQKLYEGQTSFSEVMSATVW